MQNTYEAICPAIECEGCADSIRRSLGRLAGVQLVKVDVGAKHVKVEFNPAEVNEEALKARLEAAGFPPA